MASSSSASAQPSPDKAPLLRQPPPSAEELAQCEDDIPVDIYSGKQQRLLTASLHASWGGPGGGRPFIALANVGLFYSINRPALVPDVLVSVDVAFPADIWEKRHRSYMIWQYDKPPEVVIEIVSNRVGGEGDAKLRSYALMGIAYYVIYDPTTQLSDQVLRLYELRPTGYAPLDESWLSGVELGLTLWQGKFEDREDTWLRWCNREGQLLLTGLERAEQERQRAEQERQRAEQERQRAEQAQREVERLAARLRELGVDPDG